MNTVKDVLIVALLSVLVVLTCLQEGDVLNLKHRTFVTEGGLIKTVQHVQSVEGRSYAFRKYMAATAILKIDKTLTNDFGFTWDTSSSGSGVFVSPSMLLTAKHCVENRKSDASITVCSAGGMEYVVTEVIEDVDDDMALLVIEGVWEGPHLEIGTRPYLGDGVICVGSPFSYENKKLHLTWARVAAENCRKHSFAYDGFAWHGCSGGPVIRSGRLVGIIRARHNGGNALGYATYIDRLDPAIFDRLR